MDDPIAILYVAFGVVIVVALAGAASVAAHDMFGSLFNLFDTSIKMATLAGIVGLLLLLWRILDRGLQRTTNISIF